MNGYYVRALAIAGLALLAACSGGSNNSTLPTGSAGGAQSLGFNAIPNTRAVCDYVPVAGQARCFALVRTDVTPLMGLQPQVSGFGPPDLISAYNLPNKALSGKGQTIGIVDAYDDPNAEADLAVYRTNFGLKACTTKNKCFKKVNQLGKKGPLPQPNASWSGEISLDLDMVSAVCPNCKIILVEGNSNYFTDLGASVDTAVTLGANVVSNSYGGTEGYTTDPDYDHPGHVIVASSGDHGFAAGPQQPCTFTSVVCVGGTHLVKGGGTRGWTESSWRSAGSGCSTLIAKPAWQHDTGCTMRSESDVSAVADPATGVAVYDTYMSHGWQVFGGTSVSSPLIGGVYGLAKNAAKQNAAQGIWAAGGSTKLNDVTTGPTNGTCPAAYLYICTPGVGYDGITGWGTPNGVKAL